MVHKSGATYAVGPATTITFLADAEGRVVGFLARDEGSPDQRLRKIGSQRRTAIAHGRMVAFPAGPRERGSVRMERAVSRGIRERGR